MDLRRDRFEFKYLVPAAALPKLRQAIAPFVEVDQYTRGESGDYTIHSIYFDTPTLRYYEEKVAGLETRRKLRVRAYNRLLTDSPAFVEIKRKNNMAIAKNRARLPYRHLEKLFITGDIEGYIGPHAADARDLSDARRFFYHMYRYSLLPIVLIHYEREAYFRKFDSSVRITFDKNLRSSSFPTLEDLFADGAAIPSLSGSFVLEVKFHDGLPSWLRSVLEDFGLERQSVSKYCTCLDEHGLPEKSSRGAVVSSSRPIHFPSGAWQREQLPVSRAGERRHYQRTG